MRHLQPLGRLPVDNFPQIWGKLVSAPGAQASAVAIARHLEWMRLRGLAEDSIYQRGRGLARLIAALPVPLLEADAAMLAVWRAALTVTPAVVCTYVGDVRQFYGWAADEGLISVNPAARLITPRVGRRLPRPIGEAQLRAALESAPPRVRPWLVLAAWCGLRAKEIAYLSRENVLDTAEEPAILIAEDATKGRSERIVPMSPFVLAELRACGLPGAGWVFRRMDGQYGANRPHIVSQLANKHLHDCGIPMTLHTLRHRFGTQTYQSSGRDLRTVQEMMGHAHPSTTANYVAYSNANARRAVNALPVPPAGPSYSDSAVGALPLPPGQHLRLIGDSGDMAGQRPGD